MPLYRYTAISATGTVATGEQLAVSTQALHDQLAAAGLKVVKARPSGRSRTWFGSHPVRPADLILFGHELLALLRAGLAIPDALELARKRPENPAFSEVLSQVLNEVRSGALLSQACARRAGIFDALFIAAVATGEKSGDLAAPLARYQDYLKRRVALRQKLSQALVYPLFLLVTLAVVMVALFVFVMPRFAAMYADFDAPLPASTRLLMAFAEHLPIVLVGLFIAALGTWVAARRVMSAGAARLSLERIADALPYFGELRRTEATALLARALSTLLAGGTPLAEALAAAREALTHRGHKRRLELTLKQVTEGGSLARAVQAARLMPETAAKMIEVGEATGKLDVMLAEVAQFYEDLLEQRLARVTALIEPSLMLLMGLLIGGIIIVMYLPIFNLAAVIR